MLTLESLMEIMPHAKNPASHVNPLNDAMREFSINTLNQQAMFIAQIAHETGELQWLEELASGRAYEGRADLGNIHPGDGVRYKGRGDFQLTGRANYKHYGAVLNIDLINNPELASRPDIAARIAGLYWAEHKLNGPAELQNIITVTRAINGGTNDLSDRAHYFRVALGVLSRTATTNRVDINVVYENKPLDIGKNCFWRANHIYIPLRKLCNAVGWGILSTANNSAVIRTPDGNNHTITYITENGEGFVNAGDLFGLAKWDQNNKTLTIN